MEELKVDNERLCLCGLRESSAHRKILQISHSLLDLKVSKALEFACRASLFTPEETLEEWGPSKCVLLSLLYGLINKDTLLCCAMAQLATQLATINSLSLVTWLRDDFLFKREEVRKGLLFLNKLIEDGFITVPKQVCEIYSSLLQKCLTQEDDEQRHTYGFHTNLDYFARAPQMNCAFQVQGKAQHFQASMTEGCWSHEHCATHYKKINLKRPRQGCIDDSFMAPKVLKISDRGFVERSDRKPHYNVEYTNRNVFSQNTVTIPPLKKNVASQIRPELEDRSCNTDESTLRGCNCNSEQFDLPIGVRSYPSSRLAHFKDAQCDSREVPTQYETLNGSEQKNTSQSKARTERKSSVFSDEMQQIPPIPVDGPSLQHLVRSLSKDEMPVQGLKNSHPASTNNKSSSKSARRIFRTEERASTSNATEIIALDSEQIFQIKAESIISHEFKFNDLTHLQQAIMSGNSNDVEKLITCESDLYSLMPGDIPLLFFAIMKRDANMVQTLLNLGIDVNQRNNEGLTALQFALEVDFTEAVKILIQETDINSRDPSGNTLLHTAILKNNLELMKFLIKLNVDLNAKNNEGLTPLHIAVKTNNTAAVSKLISAGADVSCKVDGMSLLQFAANNEFKMVRKLLKHGLSFKNEDKASLQEIMFNASKKGCDFFPELLKTDVDIHLKDECGWNALHYAIINGHKDIVNCLLNNGADVNGAGVRNSSPLHIAAMNNQISIVPLLLKHGAALDAKDCHNRTPFATAVNWELTSMAELLMKAAEKSL